MITSTKEAFGKNFVANLNHLADKEYKVFKIKTQISQTRVSYLGFILTGQRSLPQKRKEAIFSLTYPKLEDSLGVS